MSAKSAKKIAHDHENHDARGLWVDSILLSRLYGRRSIVALPVLDGNSNRLLHYADVVLGTDKKARFVSSKPRKARKKR
jgi:hypothetical protein